MQHLIDFIHQGIKVRESRNRDGRGGGRSIAAGNDGVFVVQGKHDGVVRADSAARGATGFALIRVLDDQSLVIAPGVNAEQAKLQALKTVRAAGFIDNGIPAGRKRFVQFNNLARLGVNMSVRRTDGIQGSRAGLGCGKVGKVESIEAMRRNAVAVKNPSGGSGMQPGEDGQMIAGLGESGPETAVLGEVVQMRKQQHAKPASATERKQVLLNGRLVRLGAVALEDGDDGPIHVDAFMAWC